MAALMMQPFTDGTVTVQDDGSNERTVREDSHLPFFSKSFLEYTSTKSPGAIGMSVMDLERSMRANFRLEVSEKSALVMSSGR